MNLQSLKEQRAAKVAELRTINEKAMNDNRDLDEGERTRFDALDKETRSLGEQIGRAEKIAAYERFEAQGEPVSGAGLSRELRGYSLAAAISGALDGRLTGKEAEVHQELSRGRETRAGSGVHLAVPTEILLGETRSQIVSSDPAGGYTVATNVAAVADRFRPVLMAERMGATVLRNLTGFLDLPNLATSGTTKWVQENENAVRSAVTFEKTSMAPRTITAEYRMSRRLMLQSSTSIEELLRRDLGFILAQGLDLAAINGSGVNAEPRGLLNTPGLEKVTTETLLSDTTANLMSALELDDVTGTRAFLTNPTVMKAVRKIKDADNHVIPAGDLFHGERYETTSQVPTNIGAGADKSALIYGAWAELYIGYWSSVDILINPYHPDVASNGGALLHAFLDADVAVRHIEAFAYAEI